MINSVFYFCLFSTVALLHVSGTPSDICNIVSTTNVNSVYSEWSCSAGEPSTSPCDWTGVGCDQSGAVVEIVLRTNAISGVNFPDLSNLVELTKIDFYEAALSGDTNGDIGALVNLVHLDLGGTILGGIPAEMGLLTKMTYLNLDRNYLTGLTLTPLFNMTKLVHLDLTFSGLSGPLPDFSVYPSLQLLKLGDNSYTGSIEESICTLTNLTTFNIVGSSLSGCAPYCLNDVASFSKESGYPMCDPYPTSSPSSQPTSRPSVYVRPNSFRDRVHRFGENMASSVTGELKKVRDVVRGGIGGVKDILEL